MGLTLRESVDSQVHFHDARVPPCPLYIIICSQDGSQKRHKINNNNNSSSCTLMERILASVLGKPKLECKLYLLLNV